MININAINLLILGTVIAAIGLLGSISFFANRRSVTNRNLFLFSLVTIIWGIVNYVSYQVTDPVYVIWFLRAVIFMGVWHAFTFFRLAYSFPKEEIAYPSWYYRYLFPLTILTSILTLTPFVFKTVIKISPVGQSSVVEKDPAILMFVILVLFLIISSFTILIRKSHRAEGLEKTQLKFVIIGTSITFLLLGVGNFLLPAVFNYVVLTPLGAIFILPFIISITYTIVKHRLLNIRVISSELLVFILAIVSLVEVVTAPTSATLILRIIVFVLTLVFGILLIRSVLNEVRQREHIQKLAADLSEANEKLKELDKKKTEFVSLASHQLRSPLTAIKGYSSMILEGDFGPIGDKAKDAVGRVFESSQKLVLVIEDFLNITRIELGRMKYAVTEVDIGQLTQNVLAELKPNADKRGLALTYEADTADHKVWADLGKISEVYSNLLDNSIKYTKQGSIKINLSRITNAKEGRDYVRFQIQDSGVGIGPETLPHLFEKFSRAEDASKTNIIGTGLGLYVARQIVEAHGGKIWAESPGKGQGSTFYVDLTIEGGKNLMAIMQHEQIANQTASQTTPASNPPQQPMPQSQIASESVPIVSKT